MYTLEDANVMSKAFISEQKQECLAKKIPKQIGSLYLNEIT